MEDARTQPVSDHDFSYLLQSSLPHPLSKLADGDAGVAELFSAEEGITKGSIRSSTSPAQSSVSVSAPL